VRTDGAPQHFALKDKYFWMTIYHQLTGTKCHHDYSEPGEGKGKNDAEGHVIKSGAVRAVLSGETIRNSTQLQAWASSSSLKDVKSKPAEHQLTLTERKFIHVSALPHIVM
jgi:hypothetical protein